MAHIQTVASYPDEGFAILSDYEGEFLMFKEQEDLVPLREGSFVITASYLARNVTDQVSG